MKEIFIHDIIGKLEWDLWKFGFNYFSTKKFEFLDEICNAVICFKVRDGQNITEKQVDKYKQIVDNPKKFFDMVAQSIFDYYVTDYNDFCYLEELPKITTIKELRPLLLLGKGIVIYIERDFRDYIGVSLECIWEEEHGLGVKIKDGKVIDVGFEDIIL